MKEGNTTSYDPQQLLEVNKISVAPLDARQIPLSDIFENIKYIPLETSEKSLLGVVSKVQVSDEHLFFQTEKELLVFTRNGKFDYKISKTGKGPGEYALFIDFWVDTQNRTIDILDGRLGKTIIYDWNGFYLKEQNHAIKGFSLVKWDEAEYFIYTAGQLNANSTSKLNFIQANTLVWEQFPIQPNEYDFLYFGGVNNFYYAHPAKKLNFLYTTNDTIYELTEKGASPRMIIDFGEHKIPQEIISQKYEDVADFVFSMRKTDYAYGYYSFNETENHIVFGFAYKEKLYLVFYQKQSGTTKIASSFLDDLNIKGTVQDINFGKLPYANINNKLFFILHPFDFITGMDSIKERLSEQDWASYKKEHPDLIQIYARLKLDDNPLLVEATLKKF